MQPLVTAEDLGEDVVDWLVGKPLTILVLVILAMIVRWFVHRAIDRFVRSAEDGILPQRISKISVGGVSLGEAFSLDDPGTTRRVQRAQTLGSLLKSIATGVIFGIVFVMILSELGVDIAPILASAGILGIALGFGAQSLVKDFLAGIFMIFEDQFGVGDSIDLATVSGTVEAVTLRITRLRDVNGTVWYIRNGEILRVGNQSQNWARTVLDIPVAPATDLAQVRAALKEVAHDLWIDEDFTGVVLEEPEVWGVQALTSEAMTVRVTLKTAPLSQWRVAREMRERVKARFDSEGIELAPSSEA